MISEKQLRIVQKIHDTSCTFNKLKKDVGLPSNSLSYHLQKLQDKDIIEHTNGKYALTKNTKQFYPYLYLDSKPVFAVTAVALLYEGKIYGQKKPREPKKGSKIFFGSKVPFGKSISEAAADFVKSQAGVTPVNIKLRLVNEYFQEGHWIVYFFTAETEKKPKGCIINPSDKNLFGDTALLLEHISNKTPKVKLL